MRKRIALGAAIAVLAIGGTAVAAPGGGGPLGLFGADREEGKAELARDLAGKLGGGVSAAEVRKALDQVHEERHAERRSAQAKALAAELDGVSVAQVEAALKKAHDQFEQDRTAGTRPERGAYLATLAKELGQTEAQLRTAHRAAHRKQLEARLDEAVKDGDITKARADQISKRLADGRGLDGPGHRGGRRFHGGGPGGPGPFGP